MAVVTISRQYGCDGPEIGRLVANILGAQYLDSELIFEAAQRIGVPADLVSERDERIQGITERLLEDVGRAFTGLRSPEQPLQPRLTSALTDAQLLAVTRGIIAEAARRNNVVIVGRGSQVLLRDHPTALHVHLMAPLDFRIEQVARRRQVSPEEARRLIAKIDAERAAYLRTNYHANWQDPLLYHLLLNVGLLSREAAVQIIVLAAAAVDESHRFPRPRGPQTDELRLLSSLQTAREAMKAVIHRFHAAP